MLELDFDDALDRIGRDIVDAKTIMLLQWAALKGPFAAPLTRRVTTFRPSTHHARGSYAVNRSSRVRRV